MNLSFKDKVGWFLIAYGLFSFFRGGGVLPAIVSTPATAATYVYEQRETQVPTGVKVGINRLNREKKIVASLFDKDTLDGGGEAPDQYKVPLAEAEKAGLPAFVVTAGDKVLSVVKAPTTEEQIVGAVQ